MKNIVVFASGSGSNFQSIIDATLTGKINARIVGLISNKHGIKALERARINTIPTFVISEKEFDSIETYEEKLIEKILFWETDFIVLAGFLRKIPSSLIQKFDKKILNIHPSLLPKFGGKGFYGLNVHKAVIQAKEEYSGCTIHLVSDEYDTGSILAQAKVPVLKTDTPENLATRVLKMEHTLYPQTISNYINTFS